MNDNLNRFNCMNSFSLYLSILPHHVATNKAKSDYESNDCNSRGVTFEIGFGFKALTVSRPLKLRLLLRKIVFLVILTLFM